MMIRKMATPMAKADTKQSGGNASLLSKAANAVKEVLGTSQPLPGAQPGATDQPLPGAQPGATDQPLPGAQPAKKPDPSTEITHPGVVGANVEALRAAATRLRREADEAMAYAQEAMAEAQKKAQEADAAAAAAENKVLVTVPVEFRLNTGAGVITYKAGSYPMPRDHAEHSYARAHGVSVVGLPTG